MKRVKFQYEVLTVIELTKEEVMTLSELCENHYDAAVRALSIPGIGAVLNGARNTFLLPLEGEEGKQSTTIRVTSRQLDTLCKAAEKVRSAWVDRTGNADLFGQLLQLLREAHREWERQNPEDPTPKQARQRLGTAMADARVQGVDVSPAEVDAEIEQTRAERKH